MRGFKECIYCHGTGIIRAYDFNAYVPCPYCLKRRYEKKIKKLKMENEYLSEEKGN